MVYGSIEQQHVITNIYSDILEIREKLQQENDDPWTQNLEKMEDPPQLLRAHCTLCLVHVLQLASVLFRCTSIVWII